MVVPLELVREAFGCAGEKLFPLARVVYPAVFRTRWRDAVLAFAYLKGLDDAVDEDPNPSRAQALLTHQRALIARAYRGEVSEGDGPLERFGLPVFARDRTRGEVLSTAFLRVLDSMEFDTWRRGERLSAAALDAYVLDLGGAVLTLFATLAIPRTALPAAVLAESSRAYLYADALIDVRHDLACGVINIPREDLLRYNLSGAPDDIRLPAWMSDRAPSVMAHFSRACTEARRLRDWPFRLFLLFVLAAKRRKLRRFLSRTECAHGHAAATPRINGST